MDRSHIEFRGRDTDIVSMRLRHETDSRGTFQLSGIISPYTTNPTSTLAVQTESFLLSDIVGPELNIGGIAKTHTDNFKNL